MLKIEELEKQINEQELKGIYLLYGEEMFLLQQQLNKIKKKALKSAYKNNKYYK